MSRSGSDRKSAITQRPWFRVLAIVGLISSLSIAWLLQQDMPMGVVIAIFISLMGKKLPPPIFGHGMMSGTPEVPDNLMPRPRPKKEMFLDLPGGFKMPQNGLGMCCRPTAYDNVLAYRTVLWYLLQGGRHIDGAHVYLNHNAIGKAVAEAVRRGVPRSEIFVTTKIFPTHYGYESSKKMVDLYLSELDLEYIDLILLHMPSLPIASSPCKKSGMNETECRRETWKGLSEKRNEGRVRNIGVSNFALNHLKDLDSIGAPIANNQIQFNPFEPEYVWDIIAYCKEHGITVTAYSPLGGIADNNRAMLDVVLSNISSNHESTTVSLVMLRWAMQHGFAVIPGTGDPQHMVENLGVYSFELTADEMNVIDNIKHNADGYIGSQSSKGLYSMK